MTRSLCVTCLCVLFSLPALAGFVEFAQWVPWTFLSEEIREKNFNIHEADSEHTLSVGEFRPTFENIDVKVSGFVDQLAFSSTNAQIGVRGILELKLGSILIDQMIVREFGGNVILVHVKARCEGTVISLSDLNLVSGFIFREENNWLPSLADIDLEISAWQVAPLRCEGITGISAEVENALNLFLSRPSHFLPSLKNWIAPAIDEWLKSRWPTVRTQDNDWQNLTFEQPTDDGFIIKGEIPLRSHEEVYLPNDFSYKLIGEKPRFGFSREGFRALVQDKLRQTMPSQYDLRENGSFRKLLSSRIMQYLVWPDLRRFHSSNPFLLVTRPDSLALDLRENKGEWSAYFSGQGSLMTLIGGSPIDYIFYSMGVSLPVRMDLKDGNLLFSSGKAQAKLAWSFGYLYQALYRPQSRIPMNILTNALGSLASEKNYEVNLPRFKIQENEYFLSNLNTEDQLITMDWL